MNPTAEAFYSACATSAFPYDIGDDPSFFASQYHTGPVTWGVCRPDARSLIKEDDCVAFFSAERDGPVTRYRFVAGLQVGRLTSHLAMSSPGEDEVFSRYLNLLVRPCIAGWEHHEPGLHPNQWHEDWIWRMCRRRGLEKAAVVVAGAEGSLTAELNAGGTRFEAATNYVVFRRDNAVLAHRPFLVAEYSHGAPGCDVWRTEAGLLALKRHVFGTSPRTLRTTNRRQPHRHVRRTIVNGDAWMRDLMSLVTNLGSNDFKK